MTDPGRRRTLPVRGWFALAVLATFVVVLVGVLASVQLLGAANLSSQDRIAATASRLREGADRWHDRAWLEVTSARSHDDDVSFVLFEGGAELHRSVAAADGGDVVVRHVEIEGTEPPLTAEISSPLGDDDLLPGVLRATVVIGGAALVVSLTFGRLFVTPLRAMRQAAKRVTGGDLTVRLPRSRITEVEEATTAFDLMTVELNRSLDQQAEIEQERRLFIAAIAHDLRTPLFSLRGSLEGLETGVADTPEKRARYLSVASEKARTLEHLVADLFDYTRLEYLDQSLHLAPLDLPDLLCGLVDGLRPQADAKNMAVVLEPLGPAHPIAGDREQLARAATNVIENAVRYTPPGGRVEVTCGSTGGRAWFTVTDTGPGIDPADLPHLFRPLYRGDRTRAAATGGAGLGLAIAHRILTAHGGTLEAVNVPSGGATFTATLPATAGGAERSGST